MADENQDSSQKTEDPTQRRQEKAFEKGQIAFSREVMHWTVLGTSAFFLLLIFPYGAKQFLKFSSTIFDLCGDALFSSAESMIYKDISFKTLFAITPLLFIVIAILGVGFAQTRLNFTFSQLLPKLERISPQSGIKKIFGKQNLVEFLKNIFKITLIGTVMIWSLWHHKNIIHTLSGFSLHSGLLILKDMLFSLFIAALSMLAVIAGFDYFYQRFTWWQKLKMSKHDIKQEHKEQEGSPEVKSRLRNIRMQRARSRMLSDIKTATVVITNPTHYAIALLWEEETMDAPKVVAKGMDFLALHIRNLAKEHKVPLVENPPLARTLYEKIDLGKEIPEEHYRTVAEVIRYVQDLKNKRF